MKAIVETMSTALVAVAAVTVIWVQAFRAPASAPASPVPIEDVQDIIAAEYVTNTMGDGAIAIVEFSDFQCPFCARHALATVPELKAEFIDSGRVTYAMLHLPLGNHPHALPAAEAAECAAEQGQFWEMRTRLFQQQQALPTADFVQMARDMGLDPAAFEACLQTDAGLARVQAHQREVERLGLQATPTLFIGRVRADGGVEVVRRVNGARSLAVFTDEISKLEGGEKE